ncbi:MAG: Maf family protein [Pseudomonadota bacterium]
MAAQRLVLASASPRRLELLRQVGLDPDRVLAPDVDETPRTGELPRQLAERLARAKLDDIAHQEADAFVVAADTVVACGRRVLDKTEEPIRARQLLELLSGRRHRVLTGVAARAPDGRIAERVALTQVKFKRLEPHDIDRYLASEEWRGKAGAYAIQGRAEGFVVAINGSWSNVVGLPLELTLRLLRGLGFAESER